MSAGLFLVRYHGPGPFGIPVENGFYFPALSSGEALHKFMEYVKASLGGVPEAQLHVEQVFEAGSITYEKGKVTLHSD